MPDPKLEQYAEALRMLIRAKDYLERTGIGKGFDETKELFLILSRAMLEIADEMTRLIEKGGH
jgi:hypothetical protein